MGTYIQALDYNHLCFCERLNDIGLYMSSMFALLLGKLAGMSGMKSFVSNHEASTVSSPMAWRKSQVLWAATRPFMDNRCWHFMKHPWLNRLLRASNGIGVRTHGKLKIKGLISCWTRYCFRVNLEQSRRKLPWIFGILPAAWMFWWFS